MSNHYYGITDLGRVRDNNEDAFVAQELKGGRILAAVIDGVGGYEGGEVAAAIAKECIEELIPSQLSDLPEELREAIQLTNDRIIEAKKSQKGREKMACVLTLVLADPEQNIFHYAHVGDTRLYLLRGQSLVKVSKDHSFVGFLEDSSRLTEKDAMQHPKRNEVNKALGFDPNIRKQHDYIETGSSPFLPGDILMLCSDGLTDMIGSREITEILTGSDSIDTKAKELIEAANNAGGRDNVTAVVVQNHKPPVSHEPKKPMPRKKEEPLEEETPVQHTYTDTHRKGQSPFVWILLVACLGLGAALVWALNRSTPASAANQGADSSLVRTHQRAAAEQQLFTSLSNSTDSLLLDGTGAQSSITFSDSMLIDKDTFRLIGKGVILRADSSYHGPAFVLPQSSRYISLEDIVFENFPIAIVAGSNVLHLKNVRFRNCAVPISYQFTLPNDAYTNGRINQGLFFHTDSIPDNL
jgi:serine/threonine protein phosphatase PrpC